MFLWKGNTASLEVSTYINMEVIVTARVDFYAGFGQFQLNVMEVSEYGDGFLKKEIERLKKRNYQKKEYLITKKKYLNFRKMLVF